MKVNVAKTNVVSLFLRAALSCAIFYAELFDTQLGTSQLFALQSLPHEFLPRNFLIS